MRCSKYFTFIQNLLSLFHLHVPYTHIHQIWIHIAVFVSTVLLSLISSNQVSCYIPVSFNHSFPPPVLHPSTGQLQSALLPSRSLLRRSVTPADIAFGILEQLVESERALGDDISDDFPACGWDGLIMDSFGLVRSRRRRETRMGGAGGLRRERDRKKTERLWENMAGWRAGVIV